MFDILDMHAGVEDLDLNDTPAEVVEEIVEQEVRAQIAEATVEMGEAGSEVVTLVERLDAIEDTVEDLEETVEGMESLLASGNFDNTVFSQMYNRAARLNEKLGGSSLSRMGAESFSDAASAQVMSRDGMEGFTETVKGYGAKAVAFIKQIYNAVINFFIGLFNQADALDRRAKQMSEQLGKVEKLKEKVTFGGWNAYVDYAANGIKDLGAVSSEAFDAVAALAEQAKDPKNANISAFSAAYKKTVASLTKMGKKSSSKDNGDNKNVVGQINGIRILFSYYDGKIENEADVAKAGKALKLAVGKAPEAKTLSTGDSAPKADKSGLQGAITKIRADVQKLKTTKVKDKFSAAERDKVIGNLNALKGDGEKDGEKVKQGVAVVKASASTAASLTKVLASANGAFLTAGLDCVKAHF